MIGDPRVPTLAMDIVRSLEVASGMPQWIMEVGRAPQRATAVI
jgi:hypothetical protein